MCDCYSCIIYLIPTKTISPVSSCEQFRAQFRFCQVKSHVKTACESHDLNMDFCSFDNGFKKLRATISIKEYMLINIMLQVNRIKIGEDCST